MQIIATWEKCVKRCSGCVFGS